MKILVTGASSLIGRRLAARLIDRGDEVVGMHRHRSQELPHGVQEHLGDIADERSVMDAARGCDAVVHLAARVGVVGSYAEFAIPNIGGTRNLVNACRAHEISRLVHVSSPSVAHRGVPIVGEGATSPVTGRVGAHYAETKAHAEMIALAANDDALGVVALRPHLVWGPGDTQLVGRVVERARRGRLVLVNGGRALIDTTYIDNAVAALVAATDATEPGARCAGRAYVISNGEPRPIRDLVLGICAAYGVTPELRSLPLPVARLVGSALERYWPRESEPPLTRFVAEQLGTAHWFDPTPAEAELGYRPVVSIDEGLATLAHERPCISA